MVSPSISQTHLVMEDLCDHIVTSSNVLLHNSSIEVLTLSTPECGLSEERVLKEMINYNKFLGRALIQYYWYLYQKKRSGQTHRGKTICKPRRDASEENNPADTWIMHFQPPELWGNKVLLFKLSLWYFAMIKLISCQSKLIYLKDSLNRILSYSKNVPIIIGKCGMQAQSSCPIWSLHPIMWATVKSIVNNWEGHYICVLGSCTFRDNAVVHSNFVQGSWFLLLLGK